MVLHVRANQKRREREKEEEGGKEEQNEKRSSRKSQGMDIVWVCIDYVWVISKEKCMEWYRSVVSWVKLDLFQKRCVWMKEFR